MTTTSSDRQAAAEGRRRSSGEGQAPMTRRRWAVWAVSWVGGAALAVANGTVRELILVPWIGEAGARQVSTLTLVLLLAGYVWWLCRRWPLPTVDVALRAGLLWVVLTLGFEFGLGHFVQGKPWATLLADYDLSAGRIWLLVPLWTLVAPAVMTRLQQRGERRRPLAMTQARPTDPSAGS